MEPEIRIFAGSQQHHQRHPIYSRTLLSTLPAPIVMLRGKQKLQSGVINLPNVARYRVAHTNLGTLRQNRFSHQW